MPRRPAHRTARRSGLGWLAGAGVLTVGAMSALALSAASTASAAPSPHYHAGSDTATFTVTGVLDHNCLVSAGGTEVWIKPGDSIKFNSALAGINLGSLSLTLGSLGGLNVNAVVDGSTSHARHVSITNGQATNFAAAADLSPGDHTLSWTAESVSVLGGLVPSIPLSQSNLKSGASLSWRGVIHVTDSAPQCKLTVSTPSVGISVGPIHVSVPPVNVPGVKVPTGLPSVPNLNPSGSKSPTPSGGIHYTPPPVSVPDEVVPKGDTGAVYPGAGNTGYYGGPVDTGVGRVGGASSAKVASAPPVTGDGVHFKPAAKAKTVDLASSEPKPSGEIPVLLAIGAILALALVAGLYARLYLLRRT